MPTNLPHFALVVLILAAFKDFLSLATPSPVDQPDPNNTLPLRPRALDELPPDDYYEDLYGTATTSQPYVVPQASREPQQCDYDVCLELQPPCAQLALSSGCLCPGVSLNREAPETPTLNRVSKQGTEVVARWCAPYSDVTYYKVTVGGQERLEVAQDQRSVPVGKIESGAEVCVVAVNDAGASTPGEESCRIYKAPGDSSVALKAGLISGALGCLLLLLLAVLLWRHRAQRKAGPRISTESEVKPL
ncbi:leucine-rich repeat neuronal protein 4 [Aplochiton taeniatus]